MSVRCTRACSHRAPAVLTRGADAGVCLDCGRGPALQLAELERLPPRRLAELVLHLHGRTCRTAALSSLNTAVRRDRTKSLVRPAPWDRREGGGRRRARRAAAAMANQRVLRQPAPAATPSACPSAQELAAQEQVLLDVYSRLGGPGWSNQTGWASNASVCAWAGLACDACGAVVELRLERVGASGTLPASLAQLTSLEVLDILGNSVSGTLDPSLAALTRLRVLLVDNNPLSGTISPLFSAWTQIAGVYIEGTLVSGTLDPALFAGWTGLRRLNPSFSALTGTLPAEMARLTALEYFSLVSSRVSGTLSDAFSAWNMTEFWLEGSLVSGTFPGSFAAWSPTAILLGNSLLSGTMDPRWSAWTRITTLTLGPSQLSGTIPREFTTWQHLRLFNAQRTKLSGTIDPALSAWTQINIFNAELTQVSGTLDPVLSAWTSLSGLSLHSTQVSGTLRPETGWPKLRGLGAQGGAARRLSQAC
jgi:hypothetical protein